MLPELEIGQKVITLYSYGKFFLDEVIGVQKERGEDGKILILYKTDYYKKHNFIKENNRNRFLPRDEYLTLLKLKDYIEDWKEYKINK